MLGSASSLVHAGLGAGALCTAAAAAAGDLSGLEGLVANTAAHDPFQGKKSNFLSTKKD